MKHLAALSVIATCALASAVLADPCVGPTFDRPLPGALDVQTFVADVPSARYPAFWQKGTLGDYAYVIYANGEGTVRALNPFEDWRVTIQCDVAKQACETSQTATPPQDAAEIADTLAACLLGTAPAPSEPAQTVPEADPVFEPDPAAEPAPCGLAIVNEANEIATLQRLLVLAGKDPGPVDGFLGAKTFQALGDFVENANWDTPVSDAIARVDAFLCQPNP